MKKILKKIYVAFDKGSKHDFQLFKESAKEIDEDISIIGDSGYQGIDKILINSITPKKKSKNNPLTDEDKKLNNFISNIRILVEPVNCQLKKFKILSERYRNLKHTFFSSTLFFCILYNLSLVI